MLGKDLAARDAGHHGVRAVLLHVGHDTVIRVLQGGTIRGEHVLVVERREDRADGRLADVAAAPRAEALDHLGEGGDAGDLDGVEQLGARHVDVLAQGGREFDAGLLELASHNLLHKRQARAARGAGLGAGLHLAQVVAALVGDRVPDGARGDVVA
ncbi:hypothetical protein GCM10025876_04930 [Demequina litorisediminis]|uniref:Uncharacterized protein n=1 Tax=Demequina litorisediminis TaxID=1849022 RepID=A0ABQ6IC11_9MICO|nr:hypothetical protein GCM10025876_04930 [Demequina litorisediminis]